MAVTLWAEITKQVQKFWCYYGTNWNVAERVGHDPDVTHKI